MNSDVSKKLICFIFLFGLLRLHAFVIVELKCSPTKNLSYSELHGKSGTKKKKVYDGTVAVNRSARFNNEIIDTYDAGISLLGMCTRFFLS